MPYSISSSHQHHSWSCHTQFHPHISAKVGHAALNSSSPSSHQCHSWSCHAQFHPHISAKVGHAALNSSSPFSHQCHSWSCQSQFELVFFSIVNESIWHLKFCFIIDHFPSDVHFCSLHKHHCPLQPSKVTNFSLIFDWPTVFVEEVGVYNVVSWLKSKQEDLLSSG